MNFLENAAKEMFMEFSHKETGKIGNWDYLNPKRQLEWMKDVFKISDHFLKALKSELKPLPNPQRHETVYEAGYYEGARAERMFFITIVDSLHKSLIAELKEFQQNIK